MSTEQLISKAVRFDDYGGIEVLEVRDVARPEPGPDEVLYGQAKRTERLAERDERLRAGQHPGEADGRYRSACSYAERWGLEMPPGRWTGR